MPKTNQTTIPKPTPAEALEQLVQQGDVLSLLNYLEDRANPMILRASIGLLSRCIRNKARSDLSGLTDDAFARIIGMATLLLARTQLYITHRLAETETHGAHAKSGLPRDLVDEGWLDRCERISRFVSEMATIRSRVQHVNRLNAQADGSQQHHNRLNHSPMDEYSGAARNGKAASRKGRLRCSESHVLFP